ncbi:MAG: hypothetical protein NTX61_00345 [Bacteroidetes bacterium]|nr:hypothetical protein [Bacteroidota bacterium]
MKKLLFILSVMLIAGSAFFSSCSKSDTTPASQPPSITFGAGTGYLTGDATINAGTGFRVNIVAFPNTTSTSKLTKLTVTRVQNNNPTVAIDTTFSLTSLNIVITAHASATAGTEKWFYKITDAADQAAEVSLTITTVNSSGPINTFSMKILGAQHSTAGSSFASSNGNVYLLADAKTNQTLIDWVYYYGASDFASIAAPDDDNAMAVFNDVTNGLQTWSIRNATRFNILSDAITWDAITNDAVIIQQTATGVDGSRIVSLSVGNYLAFITSSGKKGLIKVESITDGADGEISISVKVQQ